MRDAYDGDATRSAATTCGPGSRELGVGRPARARGARRRGHGHGRRRGRARGARRARCARRRTRRRRSARCRSCSPRARAREHAFLLPGLADGTTIGTRRALRAGRALRCGATAATARRADGDGWRDRRHEGARRRRRGRRPVPRHRARRRRRCSACSRCRATTTASRSSRPPTVDGSRKEATVDVRRRARAGGSAPATRPTRSRARSTGSAVAYVVDGVGAAAARAGARGRVRQGARAVRQADRLVPGRAAPVRRHAAHASSSAAPRATTRAGPPTTPNPRRRTAPR